MDKIILGLNNVVKIVYSVIKTVIAFAVLLWLADKVFGLKLNIIKLDFIDQITVKELTTIVVLLLIWLGFKDVK